MPPPSAPTPLLAPGLTPKADPWPELVGRTPVLLRAKASWVATIRRTAAMKIWMVTVVVTWDFRMFSPVCCLGDLWGQWEQVRGLRPDCIVLTAKRNGPRPLIGGWWRRKWRSEFKARNAPSIARRLL